jgi:hypothetical protein
MLKHKHNYMQNLKRGLVNISQPKMFQLDNLE